MFFMRTFKAVDDVNTLGGGGGGEEGSHLSGKKKTLFSN